MILVLTNYDKSFEGGKEEEYQIMGKSMLKLCIVKNDKKWTNFVKENELSVWI